VVIQCSTDNNNIVEIYEHMRFECGAEYGIEEALKRRRRGMEPERHDAELH